RRELDLEERRVARREANVAVVRVLAVRKGRAGLGQLDAGLAGEAHDLARVARRGVEAGEVAAARAGPGRDGAVVAELFGEHALDRVELRLEDGGVPAHVRLDPGEVLEEAHVA